MEEKRLELPLPSVKVTKRTPESVKKALEEVEKTFIRTKKIAATHRKAIEEARKESGKDEENFDIADVIEDEAQKISRKGRKTPLYTKTPKR